jgi:hypothetical protein
MKSLTNNEDAVSVNVEYILFSIIFLGFFLIVLLSADDLLIQGPKNVVVNEQFRDIGNMMSNTITNMYLIAPENGNIETTYRIPTEIGKETYAINADQAFIDQIIEVESMASDKRISVTINGIASTIPINGTAQSSAPLHRISYDSRR